MLRALRRVWSRAVRAAVTPAGLRPRLNPFPNFLDRLEDRVVPAFGPTGLLAPAAATGQPIAEVTAGTRLASVDTTQSALLNGLLGSLAGGGSLQLTAVDYNGLANTDLNLGVLLTDLQAVLGVATPTDVLTADVTLGQLLGAVGRVGGTGAADAVADLLPQLGGLTATIQLGDLFDIDLPAVDSLNDVELNALDLLTGSVQLFNSANVLTTPTPVTLSGAALGAQSLLNSVTLQAQVVEPPVIVVGPAGTQFHSAQIRVKLGLDLVDISPSAAALAGITGPVADLLNSLGLGGAFGTSVNATLTLGQFDLYAEIAGGSGTIQSINALTGAVTLQATPSIADLYLGTIADGVFFNRSRPLNPATDLTPATVGSLSLSATVLGLPLPIPGLDQTLGVTVRASALGQGAGPTTVEFTPPYPRTITVGSSSIAVGNLVTGLVSNLEVGVTGALGILNPLLGTVTSALDGVAGGVLSPVLTSVAGQVLDPALVTLGVGIGEIDLTVLGVGSGSTLTATPDSIATLRGSPVTANLLANDVIPIGTAATATLSTLPANGTAVLTAAGSVTYTPAAGFVGTDTFTYTLSDGLGATSTATVTVFVGQRATPPNGAPTVNPDVVSTPGAAVAIAVLANDTDPDGDPLTLIGVSQPANGTAAIGAGGVVIYTPNGGFVGTDTFTYAAGDGSGGIGMATVTVIVGPPQNPGPNGAPVANPDTITTTPGVSVTTDVTANDTDPDGDQPFVIGISQPPNGTVTLNPNGTVIFTPAPGATGTSQFVYTASDGHGGTSAGTVTVTIVGGGGNRAPTVNPDIAATSGTTPVTIAVLANDTDPDGNPLTISGVTQPASGTVTVNGNNTLTYTPAGGFVGTVTFGYTASDGAGGSGSATVTVTVGPGGPGGTNTPPVAMPDIAGVPSGASAMIAVLANDFDADGDPLTVSGVTPPANGTVSVSATGVVTYTPRTGFVGTDTFTYTASDGRGGTATGLVTVMVNGGTPPVVVPGGPVVNGDSAFTQPGQAVTIPVLANDSDPAGGSLTITGVSQPARGTVVVNADGTITYTPAAGFRGVDGFSYTASNGGGLSGTARVQVTVGSNGPGPALPDVSAYAVGADTSGGPRVTVYNSDGSVRHNFFAYDPDTRFGVNVALSDLTGDGVVDIITTPGFGGGPHVRVLDGVTLREVASFFAFDANFRGGVSLAAGDVTGDGIGDLIVSAGPGGGPRVRVIDGTKLGMINPTDPRLSGATAADFFAFDSAFGGGVSLAVADRDGDGVCEVVTGAGVGGPPRVRIWDAVNGRILSDFLAFDPGVTTGVNVGGRGEYFVVALRAGGPPAVHVYRGVGNQLVSDFLAYEPSFTGGVRVNFGDSVDPTKPVLLTGAGPGGGPRIKVLRPNADVVIPDYFAFEESFRGGVYVA